MPRCLPPQTRPIRPCVSYRLEGLRRGRGSDDRVWERSVATVAPVGVGTECQPPPGEVRPRAPALLCQLSRTHEARGAARSPSARAVCRCAHVWVRRPRPRRVADAHDSLSHPEHADLAPPAAGATLFHAKLTKPARHRGDLGVRQRHVRHVRRSAVCRLELALPLL